MAKNMIYDEGDSFAAVPTQPASGATSGSPVLVGQMPGVALTDADATSGKATIQFEGVADLAVEGKDASNANTTVSPGDIVYYDAANTIKLNRDNTNGVRFGYALEALASGANGTIRVKIGY